MFRHSAGFTLATLLAFSSLTLAACATSTPSQGNAAPPSQESWTAGQAAWLEWNAKRRGWSVTDSGLQYRRIGSSAPEARQPVATDRVRVHYRGTLINGTEFDSSYSRGEPAEFPLNRVIGGWTEGVALMRVGETFEFAIPADLAYGERWVADGAIPPGSVLIFQVELLDIL